MDPVFTEKGTCTSIGNYFCFEIDNFYNQHISCSSLKLVPYHFYIIYTVLWCQAWIWKLHFIRWFLCTFLGFSYNNQLVCNPFIYQLNLFSCSVFKLYIPLYCIDPKIVRLQNNAGMLWCCFCLCTPKRSFWRKDWIFSGTDGKYMYILIPCKISSPSLYLFLLIIFIML